MVLHWGTQKFQQLQLTMDCDPLRWWMCPFPAIPLGPNGPMVPLCVRSWPFWCGNVWNCIALLGSISSRNPSRWNVAYGQISSSIPGMAHQYVKRKMQFIVIHCDEREQQTKGHSNCIYSAWKKMLNARSLCTNNKYKKHLILTQCTHGSEAITLVPLKSAFSSDIQPRKL